MLRRKTMQTRDREDDFWQSTTGRFDPAESNRYFSLRNL